MALDPSIITGIRPVQIDSPVNALAQVLKVQSMQQGTQLGQAKLDEYQRSKTRQNKLLDLVQSLPSGTTDTQRIDALKGGGYFDEADKLESGVLSRRKIESEAQDKEWQVQKEKLTFAGNAFGGVMKNPTLENALGTLDYLGSNNLLQPDAVAKYKNIVQSDPAKIAALAEQAYRSVLDAKEQIGKVSTNNLGGTTQTIGVDPVTGKATVLNSAVNTTSPDAVLQANTSRANNAATVAATVRGQNLTDARARELNANSRGQYDAARGVLVDTRTGSATAVTGPDGKPLTRDKAMTEFQGKSAAFGDRASAANQIITGLEGKYSPAAINSKTSIEDTPLIGGMLGAATNKFALSEGDQRAEQAQRDFINAVLRQESGAAIGAGEFDNARKQYFPQPGDSAAVRAQKAANRKLAVEGLQRNAGSNYQPATPAAQPSAPQGQSGIKFLGFE